ncbi:MAG: endonuclease/exonuclease/phosphatase family protein, partial [Phycisphaerales bacterium]|nr:endonuclease/exonuclease/phosphatase family protein [Phycisphaerales bacterium]
GEAFVVMGDLNADPEQGDSVDNAIGQLLGHARVRKGAAPEATSALEDEHGAITSSFGLRVDYVLASAGAEVVAQGVYWRAGDGPEHGGAAVDAEVVSAASDHHPVWVELVFPEAGRSSETRDE